MAIELKSKEILGLNISKERNMFVAAERFPSNIVDEYGQHAISTDGGTWYPQACKFLKIDHHIQSPFEKSHIKRTMHHIKDRTDTLTIIFQVEKRNVNCYILKLDEIICR